jgi:hypothetical protein
MPSVTIRSKIRDIGFLGVGSAGAGDAEPLYNGKGPAVFPKFHCAAFSRFDSARFAAGRAAVVAVSLIAVFNGGTEWAAR